MDPWFGEQMAGVVGGGLGAAMGTIFGGIGGGVGGTLAAMGRARTLVLGFFIAGVVVGLGLAITGLVALAMGQPWWVWCSFLLPGVLGAGIMGGLLPVVRARYAQAEQRRMDAAAIGG
ncbi:MAG: hypothetical protein KIT54_04030 [Phycisphaeraceae bacterium]|nr:hypothetical protein [Phycisphaeraceae bacterium]